MKHSPGHRKYGLLLNQILPRLVKPLYVFKKDGAIKCIHDIPPIHRFSRPFASSGFRLAELIE